MFRVTKGERLPLWEEGSRDRSLPDVTASPPALSRFSSDERGNIAMMFGLFLAIMCMFTGLSVDLGRWMLARQQTQEAVDAAVLAGLKKY